MAKIDPELLAEMRAGAERARRSRENASNASGVSPRSSQKGRRIARFADIVLYSESIEKGRDRQPLRGASATVELGSTLQKRITMTRLAAIGIFAFAAKKKSGGETYLLIDGPSFQWVVEVDRKSQAKARDFAAKVTSTERRGESHAG